MQVFVLIVQKSASSVDNYILKPELTMDGSHKHDSAILSPFPPCTHYFPTDQVWELKNFGSQLIFPPCLSLTVWTTFKYFGSIGTSLAQTALFLPKLTTGASFICKKKQKTKKKNSTHM